MEYHDGTGWEIKLKIGVISRDNSEYCHYAIPETEQRIEKNPGKLAESEWATAEISPTPNIQVWACPITATVPAPVLWVK